MDINIYTMARLYLDWAMANPPGRHRLVPPSEHGIHQADPMVDQWNQLTSWPLGPPPIAGAPINEIWQANNNGSTLQVGVRLSTAPMVDQLSTAPGGLTLMFWGAQPDYPAVPVVDLDMANDIGDRATLLLRDPIVAALKDRGMPFMPISFRAISNVGNRFGNYELVDHVGLQCVFRAGEAYYISGYDKNETPPLYFMARLPHGVETLAEAIEALKPSSVKLAEAKGLEVLRQGDMFAIPTIRSSGDLSALGAVFSTTVERTYPRMHFDVFTTDGMPRPIARTDVVTHTFQRGLYGTAHTCSEMALLPDGTMFGRGVLVHDPKGVLRETRNPDHKPLELPGPHWHLVVKNTVPTVGRG